MENQTEMSPKNNNYNIAASAKQAHTDPFFLSIMNSAPGANGSNPGGGFANQGARQEMEYLCAGLDLEGFYPN